MCLKQRVRHSCRGYHLVGDLQCAGEMPIVLVVVGSARRDMDQHLCARKVLLERMHAAYLL